MLRYWCEDYVNLTENISRMFEIIDFNILGELALIPRSLIPRESALIPRAHRRLEESGYS